MVYSNDKPNYRMRQEGYTNITKEGLKFRNWQRNETFMWTFFAIISIFQSPFATIAGSLFAFCFSQATVWMLQNVHKEMAFVYGSWRWESKVAVLVMVLAFDLFLFEVSLHLMNWFISIICGGYTFLWSMNFTKQQFKDGRKHSVHPFGMGDIDTSDKSYLIV